MPANDSKDDSAILFPTVTKRANHTALSPVVLVEQNTVWCLAVADFSHNQLSWQKRVPAYTVAM